MAVNTPKAALAALDRAISLQSRAGKNYALAEARSGTARARQSLEAADSQAAQAADLFDQVRGYLSSFL